jgi:hypothetical protein
VVEVGVSGDDDADTPLDGVALGLDNNSPLDMHTEHELTMRYLFNGHGLTLLHPPLLTRRQFVHEHVQVDLHGERHYDQVLE